MASTVKIESKNAINKTDLATTRNNKSLSSDFFPDCWINDDERMDVRILNINLVFYLNLK